MPIAPRYAVRLWADASGTRHQRGGDKHVDELAARLPQQGLTRCDRRELYRYRQFFLSYPQIVESLPPQLSALLPAHRIVEAPTPQTTSGKTLLESLFSLIWPNSSKSKIPTNAPSTKPSAYAFGLSRPALL